MGDEVFPVLATIILVATLITLIVAVASYIVFKVKEKRRALAAALAPQEIVPEMLDDPSSSRPHFRRSDLGEDSDRRDQNNPEGNRNIGRRATDKTGEPPIDRRRSTQTDSDNVTRRKDDARISDHRSADSKVKEVIIPELDSEEISSAQSAFMKSMRDTGGEADFDDSSKPLQLKKFDSSKRELRSHKETKSSNEGARWR